jgi:hypothetical protein
MQGKEEICFAKGTFEKPLCPEPECKVEHAQWIHEVRA